MAFGKIRHTQILGEKGTTWYVEIWQRDYTGSSIECDLQGEGFEIKWSGQGNTRDRTFIGSECSINLYIKNNIDENFLYEELLKKGEQYHYVRIYKNNINDVGLWWFGWIQPGFDSIQNAPYPYSTKISATDSYGYFTKRKESQLSGEVTKKTPLPISNHLLDFGSEMQFATSTTDSTITPNPGLRQWLRMAIDWWRPEDTYQGSNPFDIYATTIGAFTERTKYDDEGNVSNFDEAYQYKKSDVIDGSLKAFNTIGFLAEGYYYFIQPNSLVNNNNGTLNVWQRRLGVLGSTSVGNVDTVLAIDQSNNIILGGSTLMYDPSFESVRLDYVLGGTSFYISPTADLTTSFVAGAIQLPTTTDDFLSLNFHAIHREQITSSQFSFGSLYDYTGEVRASSFKTTAFLIVSITDGTTTKYLKEPSLSIDGAGLAKFIWTTTPTTITIKLGYDSNVGDYLSINYLNTTQSNPIYSQNFFGTFTDDTVGPCAFQEFPNDTTPNHKFRTDINFSADIEAPGIQGDVSIELTATNDYSQVIPQTSFPGGNINSYSYQPLNDPTPTSISTVCSDINLSVAGNGEFSSEAYKLEYQANQTQVTSSESYDLKELKIGSSEIDKMFSVQHFNSSTKQWESSTEFQRGNPSPDDPDNISQLLVNEFLALQVEPLEILQADIQSNNISPLRLIKYSLNDDSSIKYYSFLGGTFKAQSEIMSGEWYKVNDDIQYVTSGTTSEKGLIVPDSQTPTNVLNQSVLSVNNIIQTDLSNDNIGVIDTAIPSNTSDDKVQIDGTTSSKVYNNQELVLSYPDGSNAIVVKSRSESNKGATQVLLDDFITNIIYPVGSILRPLKSDLTNVKAENVLDVRTAHYHHSSALSTYYIPISGATTAEGTLSTSAYHLMFTVPYDGFVKTIHNYNSHNSSKFSFITFHKAASTTATGDTITTPTYTNNFEVDCPSNWTFTKGDIISFGRADSSQVHGVSMSIVLQYNTQPPAQPQP